MINDVILEYYEFIVRSTNKIADKEKEEYLQDFVNDLIIILIEKQDIVIELHKKGELKYYILKIISNNLKSKTSPFYSKYRKKLPYVEPDMNEENI